MNNFKGIVFFDYDGTLADEKEGIFLPTAATRQAAAKLRKNGYAVMLCTGRALCYVPECGISFDGYVTSNGAYAEVEKKEVFSDYVDSAELFKLTAAMDELGLYYSLERQDMCYAKDKNEADFRYMLDNFRINPDVFFPLEEKKPEKIAKLLLACADDAKAALLAEKFKGSFVFEKHRKNASYDIGKYGVSKGKAVEAVISSLGISRADTYAFGDGTNDYDFLRAVGHGIAMGYHAPILDEAAEYVTDTVKNEGITKALLKYKLID